MKCKTRDFGEIDVPADAVIKFTQPPFGFEVYKNYFLLFDESIDSNVAWLQSADERDICFVIMRDDYFGIDYTDKLPRYVSDELGQDGLEIWFICVIPDNLSNATVNLKSPVVINPKTQLGMQIILEDDFPISHRITEKVV